MCAGGGDADGCSVGTGLLNSRYSRPEVGSESSHIAPGLAFAFKERFLFSPDE